jgi:diaminohydroxyphosphoribosylaminopyrimidine deaminase/5-amino-6-(5-phosphoribosylamino)uracil reductase
MKNNPWTVNDRTFMTLALDLAKKGAGQVEPNPAVGAVIVKNGKIIGQGYHHVYGAAHAEVDAIRNARSHARNLANSTLYVTLEPCCHWGKTPPCTNAVIAAGIKKVIAAVRDPSKKVAGKGLDILKKAGIEVSDGLMSQEAQNLNAWFFKFHQTGRPWVICKWAQTLDGKLSARTGHSQWISCEKSREESHRIRKTCQAIVVGVETVLADDPSLPVRLGPDSSLPAGPPCRIVLDSRLRIPLKSNLVKTAGEVPTWVITTSKAKKSTIERLTSFGVHVKVLPADSHGRINLKKFLTFAANQGWARVFVEGGAGVLSSFLSQHLADELVIFQAPALALDEQAVQFKGLSPLKAASFLRDFQFQSVAKIGDDVILRLWRK